MPVFNELTSKTKAGIFMLCLRTLQTTVIKGTEITAEMILEKMKDYLPKGLTVDIAWVNSMLEVLGDISSGVVWLMTDIINDELAENLFSPTATLWEDLSTFFKGVI